MLFQLSEHSSPGKGGRDRHRLGLGHGTGMDVVAGDVVQGWEVVAGMEHGVTDKMGWQGWDAVAGMGHGVMYGMGCPRWDLVAGMGHGSGMGCSVMYSMGCPQWHLVAEMGHGGRDGTRWQGWDAVSPMVWDMWNGTCWQRGNRVSHTGWGSRDGAWWWDRTWWQLPGRQGNPLEWGSRGGQGPARLRWVPAAPVPLTLLSPALPTQRTSPCPTR